VNQGPGSLGFPEPFFLEGKEGRLFCLYQPALGERRGAVLFVPAFAEEMNRCRFTVARQTRQLARLGYASLLLDPFGTGDSEGDLPDASWEIWRNDVIRAADWLQDRVGIAPTLWGLRLGALLAADVAQHTPGRFSRMVFWQPVLDGRLYLTQYLRLRVASLMDRGLPPETTDGMREALLAGSVLEVAGYRLSGVLTGVMDGVRMSDFSTLSGLEIDWFELVSETDKPFTMVSNKLISQLTGQGCTIHSHGFTGPAIWQLHSRDEVPVLIEMTTDMFRGLA